VNVRHSSYSRKALKHCWSPNGREFRDEECDSLCQSCSDVDDCGYPTKFMMDHRLHTLPFVEPSFAGVIFQAQYQRGADARHGVVKQSYIDAYRDGLSGGSEANLADQALGRKAWFAQKGRWDDDLETHLDALSEPEPTFEVDRSFVQLGGCDSCVYKDMCLVPERRA